MLTSDAGQMEVTELEALLDAECGCEMEHSVTQCSEIVVALSRCCRFKTRMCQNATSFRLQEIADNLSDCAGCNRQIADCWRIIPI